jgi:hypothetical protein
MFSLPIENWHPKKKKKKCLGHMQRASTCRRGTVDSLVEMLLVKK